MILSDSTLRTLARRPINGVRLWFLKHTPLNQKVPAKAGTLRNIFSFKFIQQYLCVTKLIRMNKKLKLGRRVPMLGEP